MVLLTYRSPYRMFDAGNDSLRVVLLGAIQMNMHVTPASAVALPCLFKVGDFVRLKGGEIVGRVLEATKDGLTGVQLYDNPEGWDEKFSFGPGCLTMWTPDVVVPNGTGPEAALPFDFERLKELTIKQLGAFELLGDLARAAQDAAEDANDESFRNNVELVADTFSDMPCEVLDMLLRREN
jgi:hypothetical protein